MFLLITGVNHGGKLLFGTNELHFTFLPLFLKTSLRENGLPGLLPPCYVH